MSGGIRVLALLPWLIAALAAPASAALIGYNDASAWATAAASGNLFLEDFESYNADTQFRTTTVDTGGFTIAKTGGEEPAATANTIDTSPFAAGGTYAIDGDAYVLGFVNTRDINYVLLRSQFIEIVFDEPIFAWGADFAEANSGLGLLIYLFPADGLDPTDPNEWVFCAACSPGTGFAGFVANAGEMYTRIGFVPGASDTGGQGQTFGMDNVVWATAPEPGTAALLGLGLTGLAVVGRRRH